MWFFFGIFTLIASTIWGLKTRLAAKWQGSTDQIGKHRFDLQEVRHKERLRLVRLGTKAPAGLHFRVRAERSHDRFFKWLGVTSEIQTRDAEFDRKVYVVAILLKRNPQLRSALVNIFLYAKARRLRKMRLRCANKRLWLEFSPKVEHDLFAAKTYLAPLLHTLSSDPGAPADSGWHHLSPCVADCFIACTHRHSGVRAGRWPGAHTGHLCAGSRSQQGIRFSGGDSPRANRRSYRASHYPWATRPQESLLLRPLHRLAQRT